MTPEQQALHKASLIGWSVPGCSVISAAPTSSVWLVSTSSTIPSTTLPSSWGAAAPSWDSAAAPTYPPTWDGLTSSAAATAPPAGAPPPPPAYHFLMVPSHSAIIQNLLKPTSKRELALADLHKHKAAYRVKQKTV